MRVYHILVLAIAFLAPIESDAAPLTFNIDSNRSSFHFGGSFQNANGELIPIIEQFPGSLSVPLMGAFNADVSNGTIELYFQTVSQTPPDRLVIPPGNFPSESPKLGDIGVILIDPSQEYLSYTAIRNVALTFATGVRSILEDGTFDVGGAINVFVRDQDNVVIIGDQGIVGYTARNPYVITNAPSQNASLVRNNDEVTITIPIHFKYSFNSGSFDLTPFDTAIDATIVATAAIPETTPFVQLLLLLSATLIIKTRRSRGPLQADVD